MARPGWPDTPPAPDGFPRAVLTSSTDADLAVHHRPARGTARASVCILHDVAEHAGRYAAAAAVLSDAGFHVYAHDCRGHGATRAFDAPLGVFAARDGFARVVEDSVAVHERARAAHRLPVIALGLGLGGLVALRQAQTRPDSADGIAIWNADVDARALAGVRRLLTPGLFGGERRTRQVLDRLLATWSAPFAPRRTPFDWLSADPAQVDAFIADPLCGFAPSIALWRDVADAAVKAAEEGAFGAVPRATPFHLLAGSDDPVTESGAGIVGLDLKLRDLGFTDVSRVILGGARHATLHDGSRDEALKLLVRWIDHVAAGQKSLA